MSDMSEVRVGVSRLRYIPPLIHVIPGDMQAQWVDEFASPVMADFRCEYVHCGPAAHLPAVPTPEEILRHAEGLGRVLLGGN